jgi:RNA polymerase sigma-70 factor, ECF subfamily
MSQVYDTYAPLVATICTHGFKGGFRGFFDPVEREDGQQQIFAAAFEERARLSYDGLKPYSAFLRGIARNVIRRMLEKRKRFERTPEQVEAPERNLELDALESEQLGLMRRFRQGVDTDPDKTILNLYYVEGWPEERLAAHIGLTRYKTRKVIASLHKQMVKHMKRHGYGVA